MPLGQSSELNRKLSEWLLDQQEALAAYGPIGAWDTSKETTMSYTSFFSVDLPPIISQEWSIFNEDLNKWDVSSCTDMSYLFTVTENFSSDLNSWDVSSVLDFRSMFDHATAFNGDINAWDVSAARDLKSMFAYASEFNRDLSAWDVSAWEQSGMFDSTPVASGSLLPCWHTQSTCSLSITVVGGLGKRKMLEPNPGVKTVDPAIMSATNTYRVGTTYRIAPIEIEAETAYSYMLLDPPAGIYVNSKTGVVLATFGIADVTTDASGSSGNQPPLTVKVQVVAEGNGRRAEIETLTMHVADRTSFTLVLGDRLVTERYRTQYLGEVGAMPTLVAVDRLFRVAARSPDPDQTILSKGDIKNITFSFKVLDTATGDEAQLDRVSIKPNGELLGQFSEDEIGTYTFVITATDGGGESIHLDPFLLDVRKRDIDVPAFGPNKQGCANKGVPVDDASQFDGKFSFCNCSGIALYVGQNCDALCKKGERKKAGICVPEATEFAAGPVLASAGGAFVVLLLLTISAMRYHKYRLSMRPIDFNDLNRKMLDEGTITHEQLVGDRKPRELKRSSVVLLEQVGKGAFGAVWKAMLDESSITGRPEYHVAAKTALHQGAPSVLSAATDDLTTEALVMAQLAGHKNLVSIIGVVTSGHPLILVLAYCDHGSIFSHLRKRAADGRAVSTLHKIDFGAQTARGMEHLSARQFIHRDLAARNVLLTSGQSVSKLVCKVADFGLSRAAGRSSGETGEGDGHEFYYKSQQGTFPVRWTAPESMAQLKFTRASDIWSFGIVAIELIQDGAKPFPNIKSNPDVVRFAMGGGVHAKPLECNSDASLVALYNVACKCFAFSPAARPSFEELAVSLEAIGLADETDFVGANVLSSVLESRPATNEHNTNHTSTLGYGLAVSTSSLGCGSGRSAEEAIPPRSPKSAATNERNANRSSTLGYGLAVSTSSLGCGSGRSAEEAIPPRSPRSAATNERNANRSSTLGYGLPVSVWGLGGRSAEEVISPRLLRSTLEKSQGGASCTLITATPGYGRRSDLARQVPCALCSTDCSNQPFLHEDELLETDGSPLLLGFRGGESEL
jgi:serine/threonine protein kinase